MVALEAGAPRGERNAGFDESAPAEGILKSEGAEVSCTPPVVGVADPKRLGFGALSAVVAGIVDSVGFAVPKSPPPLGAAGVDPNRGLGVVDPEPAPAPKRLPDVCDCVVVGVADDGAAVDGVFEEPAFRPPKKLGVLDPGGGPAGVVEALPKIEPPAGPGVADEFVVPNKPPAEVPAPNRPLAGVEPEVAESVGFPGVEAPPKREPDAWAPDV